MGKKILIVEDESSLLNVLIQKFKDENFSVSSAGDGKIGLEIALEQHPDIILLDIVMPVMDGIAMLKELRKDSWGREVPVIVLTNLNDAEKMSEAVDSKVSDFLVKTNWTLSDVVKKVKEKLEI